MAIHLITAYFGPYWWLTTFELAGYTLKYHHVLLVIQSTIVFATVCGNIFDVILVVRERKLSVIKVFGQLVPAFLAIAISTLWVLHSKTNFLQNHPQVFLMMIGLLFPNLVGRIVFARMCKMDFSWFQVLVFPLIVGYLNTLANEYLLPETAFVWGLAVLYFLA